MFLFLLINCTALHSHNISNMSQPEPLIQKQCCSHSGFISTHYLHNSAPSLLPIHCSSMQTGLLESLSSQHNHVQLTILSSKLSQEHGANCALWSHHQWETKPPWLQLKLHRASQVYKNLPSYTIVLRAQPKNKKLFECNNYIQTRRDENIIRYQHYFNFGKRRCSLFKTSNFIQKPLLPATPFLQLKNYRPWQHLMQSK